MLHIRLFGTFLVTDGEKTITAFRGNRGRAFLAFLALEPNTAHERDRITTLLWEDMVDNRARRNLSVGLTRLRNALDSYTPHLSDTLLTADTHTITFHTTPTLVQCDVVAFRDHLAAVANHIHSDGRLCDACRRDLHAAVELYQTGLLPGFHADDAFEFEEWLTVARERLHQQAVNALTQLAQHYLHTAQYDALCDVAQRQIALEPWQERAHEYLILALAKSGRRQKALAQYEQCRTILREELGVDPSLALEVLYVQILEGQAMAESTAAPDTASPIEIPHNLPAASSRFFGRDSEAQQIMALLRGADTRLITLVGSGGAGKTRLAQEVGYSILSDFADGVWFVSLVGLTPNSEATDVIGAINSALEIPADSAAPATNLYRFLRGKQLLLILDNFEHLIDAAPVVSDIMARAPQVKLLCTSREALSVHAEWLVSLRGLPLPILPTTILSTAAAAEIAEAVSVQLFVERARQTTPSFAPTSEGLLAIARICHLVGGSPLGIELAAATMRYRSPATVAQEVVESLDTLDTRQRDIPLRHRGLRAVFESSWVLLARAEQIALTACSLFQGRFTMEAARQVAGVSRRVIEGLYDKSLLQAAGSEQYELHALIRQYAAEELMENGQWAAVSNRYQHYFLQQVRRAETQLFGQTPQMATQHLREIQEDIRAAWRLAVGAGDIEALQRVVVPLARFYKVRGGVWDAAADFTYAAEQLLVQEAGTSEIGRSLIVVLLAESAQFLIAQGRLADALIIAGESVRWSREGTTPPSVKAQAQVALVLARREQADYIQARHGLQAALALARQGGDKRVLLSILPLFRAPQTEDTRYLEEGLRLAQELGDQWQLAQLITAMAGTVYYKGDLVSALRYNHAGLAAVAAMENPHRAALIHNNLGDLYRLIGKYTESEYHHGCSLTLARELGDRWAESMVLEGMSRGFADRGRWGEAWDCTVKGIALSEEFEAWGTVAYYLNMQGLVLMERGAWTEAAAALHRAIKISEDGGHRQVAMESYAMMAMMRRRLGDIEGAQAWSDPIITFLTDGHILEGYSYRSMTYRVCLKTLLERRDWRANMVLDRALTDIERVVTALDDSDRAGFLAFQDRAWLLNLAQGLALAA